MLKFVAIRQMISDWACSGAIYSKTTQTGETRLKVNLAGVIRARAIQAGVIRAATTQARTTLKKEKQ